MKKNGLRKFVAAITTATMLLGNSMGAFAADDFGGGQEGSGDVEALLNLSGVDIELPTSTAVDKIFNFVLDPQELIYNAVNDSDWGGTADIGGVTVSEDNLQATAKTVYFTNKKVTVEAGGSNTGVTAAALNTGFDRYLPVGTYTYTSGDWKNGTTDATATVEKALTLTGSPKDNDTIVVTEDITKYDDSSDSIIAVNKGFTDLNVIASASVTLGTDKVSISSNSTFGTFGTNDKSADIQIQLVGTATAPIVKNAAYLVEKLDKNNLSDFGVSYNAAATAGAKGEYSMKRKTGADETYKFHLQAVANKDGVWRTDKVDLSAFAPKVNVVWSFTKSADTATGTLTNAGELPLAGLTADANFASLTMITEDGDVVKGVEPYNAAIPDGKTWTKEEGGDLTFKLKDAYKAALAGKKITLVTTLTDGSTYVQSVTLASN